MKTVIVLEWKKDRIRQYAVDNIKGNRRVIIYCVYTVVLVFEYEIY